jgi:high frequency lysogenization protein
MREGRVIALAGLFQAIALVRAIALRGGCDAPAMRQSLASVFRVDADSPEDVYGGVGNLRLGLETLIAQLDEHGKRDVALTSMAVGVLRLERSLAVRADMLRTLREHIQDMSALAAQAETGHVDLAARLAQLYTDTLSQLKPRIIVEGSPQFLNQSVQVNQIRALLLAAVRAAVLWRQLNGSQLRLVFRRRQYAMLARGLLARCMLDGS